MSELSRLGFGLVVMGALLAGVGLLLLGAGRVPWLGRLPGDFYYEGEHVRVYFPLTTALLLSALLTLVAYLLSR